MTNFREASHSHPREALWRCERRINERVVMNEAVSVERRSAP